MKNKWLRIYKRYLKKAKGGSIKDTNLNAFNDMMHDYWIGAIPGVPSGRYGEAPHDESFRQLLAEFYNLPRMQLTTNLKTQGILSTLGRLSGV